MTEDADSSPLGTDPSGNPSVITPLESGYIRAAITAALPALNWIIYATNLDVVLHIQKVTTNQAYQCVVAVMAIVSVVQVVLKRIKDGKDPASSAPRIVMSKPADTLVGSKVSFSPNAAGPAVIDASKPPVTDELSQMIADNEAFAKRLNAQK